jgi:hypothetical protein
LVADGFGVKLSLASVGKLLAKLGLTPQKPLMRAYERDPAAIEAWKRDTYPARRRPLSPIPFREFRIPDRGERWSRRW